MAGYSQFVLASNPQIKKGLDWIFHAPMISRFKERFEDDKRVSIV